LCNGVLHHTSSIEQGIRELYRVLKKDRKAFLYIYGNGGIFWTTRKVLRNVFRRIPLDYTKEILNIIGVPKNRFIFCDTWYVPVETHTKKKDLERMLTITGFTFEKVVSRNDFDVDYALEKGIPMAEVMWGEGDHRYILKK
jgi:SAM-dependent methyltransferase